MKPFKAVKHGANAVYKCGKKAAKKTAHALRETAEFIIVGTGGAIAVTGLAIGTTIVGVGAITGIVDIDFDDDD